MTDRFSCVCQQGLSRYYCRQQLHQLLLWFRHLHVPGFHVTQARHPYQRRGHRRYVPGNAPSLCRCRNPRDGRHSWTCASCILCSQICTEAGFIHFEQSEGTKLQKRKNQLSLAHLRKASFYVLISGKSVTLDNPATLLTVSRRPLSAKFRVRSHISSCEICGGQSGTVTGFSSSTLVSPGSIIPPTLHTHSFIHHRRCINLAIDSILK